MSLFAFGDCFHEKAGDSGGDMQAPSFSSEQQCACRAFSGDEFGEDILPNFC